MNYRELNVNDYTIQIFDDVFPYDYKLFLYSFCRKSYYTIGWQDTQEIENSQHMYLHSSWSKDDFEKTYFIEKISNHKILLEFLENYDVRNYVVNLSHSNDTHFAHTHREKKVLLYYANIQWKQEWAGETLFFDEAGKEIVYTSTYTPGRIIIFDGKMPHTIRPQSSTAPHFRFTISTFWSSK